MKIKDYVAGDENIEDKVLVFSAKWCGPCKMYRSGALTQLSKETDVPVIYVDVDLNSELTAEMGISSVPTTIVMVGGTKTTLAGPQTIEVLTKLVT